MESVEIPTVQAAIQDYLIPLNELGFEAKVGTPRWHPYEKTWNFPVIITTKEGDAPRK